MLKLWNPLHRVCGSFEPKALYVHLRTINKKRLWTKAIQPNLSMARYHFLFLKRQNIIVTDVILKVS